MKIKLAAVLMLTLGIVSPTLLFAGWLDDWVDSKTVTSPGYYKGQTRGYFSGGSFQARWKMSNENLVNFEPPRLKFGCGGIDIGGGGLSWLDSDRLAEKLQSILQAAPAVAIDMALKTMCKECSETVKGLETLANNLNGMMASDCQAAKWIESQVMPDIPESNALNTTVKKLNAKLGLTRDAQETKEQVEANGGKSNIDMRQGTKDCSIRFKSIFKEGSLVEHMTEELGLTDYTELVRGLVGDVLMTFDSADTQMWDMDTIPPCRANNPYSLDDFLSGSVQERAEGGACKDNSSIDFHTYVTTNLDSIANKIKNGTMALTGEEADFIDASPLPVLQTIRLGVMTQDMEGAKASLRDALSVALAYHAIDDLYKNVQYLINHAKQTSKNAESSSGDSKFCNPIIFAPAINKISSWRKTVKTLRDSARKSYRTELESLANYQVLIKSIVEQYKTASSNSMRNFGN